MKANVGKIISILLIVCGVINLYNGFTSYSILGIVQSVSSYVTISLLSFFCIAGILYCLHPHSKNRQNLIVISLLFLSIQIVIFGWSFQNYIGPYFVVGLTDTPNLKYFVHLSPFEMYFGNAIRQTENEISLAKPISIGDSNHF